MNQMSFLDFRITTMKHLQAHLEKSWERVSAGSIPIPPDLICLFPTMAMFTETPTHYVVELFGARRQHKTMKTKRNVAESLDAILGGFNYEGQTQSLFSLNTTNPPSADPSRFSNLALLHQRTLTELDSRFPGAANLFRTKFTFAPSDDAICIKSFDVSNLGHSLLISNCLIANTLGTLVRARYTNLLFAAPRGVPVQELRRALNEHIPPAQDPHAGIQVVGTGEQEGIAQASQFSSLYLRNVKETVLTRFLEDHADVTKRALAAEEIFFQPSLPWKDGNPDPEEEAIQPDMMIRRKDGSWWIVEFKLPLLDETSITAGKHRRRRFIYPVGDGIEQISNYHEYFDYQANREAAARVLKEEVQDPGLMLIAGTSENVDLTEVREAMRSRRLIDIMDYDTLIRLSLANNHM